MYFHILTWSGTLWLLWRLSCIKWWFLWKLSYKRIFSWRMFCWEQTICGIYLEAVLWEDIYDIFLEWTIETMCDVLKEYKYNHTDCERMILHWFTLQCFTDLCWRHPCIRLPCNTLLVFSDLGLSWLHREKYTKELFMVAFCHFHRLMLICWSLTVSSGSWCCYQLMFSLCWLDWTANTDLCLMF